MAGEGAAEGVQADQALVAVHLLAVQAAPGGGSVAALLAHLGELVVLVVGDDPLVHALLEQVGLVRVLHGDGDALLLGGADLFIPVLLHPFLIAGVDVGADQAQDLRLQRIMLGAGFRKGPGLLGAHLGQIDDQVDHLGEFALAERDGAQHDLFRQLLGFGLDHQHALGGAGDDQVQL